MDIYGYSIDDIKYGSKIIRATEPLGNIEFVFTVLKNKNQIMPRIFTEKWKENHTPFQANMFKRFSILLKIVVKTFLSNS
jgi:hypothetical protein